MANLTKIHSLYFFDNLSTYICVDFRHRILVPHAAFLYHASFFGVAGIVGVVYFHLESFHTFTRCTILLREIGREREKGLSYGTDIHTLTLCMWNKIGWTEWKSSSKWLWCATYLFPFSCVCVFLFFLSIRYTSIHSMTAHLFVRYANRKRTIVSIPTRPIQQFQSFIIVQSIFIVLLVDVVAVVNVIVAFYFHFVFNLLLFCWSLSYLIYFIYSNAKVLE